MDAAHLDAAARLAEATSRFENRQLITLVVLALIALGAFGLYVWHLLLLAKGKRQAAAETATYDDRKAQRADRLNANIDKQGRAILEHTKADEVMSAKLLTMLDVINRTLTRVDETLKVVSDRVQERLSPSNSRRFVEHTFTVDICREFCLIFEMSLVENDYRNRREYVSRKVKTAWGDAMNEARIRLLTFPLSLAVSDFFVRDSNASGERFLLCDEVWKKVEPYYAHTTPLAERVDESYLMIENAIKDYVTHVLSGSTVPWSTDSLPVPALADHESRRTLTLKAKGL